MPYVHAALWCLRHLTGRYKVAEIEAIRRFVRPSDICVDVGAHAGSWTRPLSTLVVTGKVFAFEALPHYATSLSIMLRLMQIHNVTVLNRAVSDHPAKVRVAWRANGARLTGNSHIAIATEDNELDCVNVEALRLDDWFRTLPELRISFIKIDIEGAELMALRGAERLIDTFRPIVFLEIVTNCCRRYGYEPSALFAFFGERSYCPYVIAAGLSFQPVTAETYCGRGDVLFVPSEVSALGDSSSAQISVMSDLECA